MLKTILKGSRCSTGSICCVRTSNAYTRNHHTRFNTALHRHDISRCLGYCWYRNHANYRGCNAHKFSSSSSRRAPGYGTAPLILPFLLSRGIGPYSGVGPEKGAELSSNLQALFFNAGSAQMFGYYNSNPVSDIRNLEGLRIWNGPPRGAALTSGRAMIQLLSGLKEGEGYEGIQNPWPDAVSSITGGGADAWTIPEGLPSGREIAIAAAGDITIHDVPSDILASKLGQQIVNAPGHAPYSVPVDEYRAAYAGNGITIVTDDDTFDSFATAFGQVVNSSMDEELAYQITKSIS